MPKQRHQKSEQQAHETLRNSEMDKNLRQFKKGQCRFDAMDLLD